MSETAKTEWPCDFGCGYYDSDEQRLWNHVFWEHRACTECGAEPGGAPDNLSVTHRSDCRRLQAGYAYPAGPAD